MRAVPVAMVVVGLTAGAASAATLNVAVRGEDSPSCGSKTDPCRTIGQAIVNAEVGGRIVVGPGRYGDLNRDGELSGIGEETFGTTSCMVEVDKPVTILSSQGAAATVVDAGGEVGTIAAPVCLVVSNAAFGLPKKGFTLIGNTNGTGARVGVDANDVTTTGIRMAGNRSVGNQFGFKVAGTGNELRGNQAFRNEQEGFGVDQGANVLAGNLSTDNGDGFFIFAAAAGTELSDNVASGNDRFGFIVNPLEATVTSCVANGNGTNGFVVSQGVAVLTKIAAIANGGAGIVLGTADSVLDGATVVGNGTTESPNCGVESVNASVTVRASRVFWGAPGGPGADPADDACDAVGPIDVVAPAAKELRVRPKLPPID
jgi:parallel beta-helix repeat protein